MMTLGFIQYRNNKSLLCHHAEIKVIAYVLKAVSIHSPTEFILTLSNEQFVA